MTFRYRWLIITVALLSLSCAAYIGLVHSGRDRYRAGDYDGATYDAARSLRENPGYDKAQALLQDAFRAAVNHHGDRVRELQASAAKFRWDDIVVEYRALVDLNRTIRDLPFMPNKYLPGGALTIQTQDYSDALGAACTQAAQAHYEEGDALSASSDEPDIQKQAALQFQKAQEYVPGYKDAATRFTQTKKAGTRRLAIIPFEDKSGIGATLQFSPPGGAPAQPPPGSPGGTPSMPPPVSRGGVPAQPPPKSQPPANSAIVHQPAFSPSTPAAPGKPSTSAAPVQPSKPGAPAQPSKPATPVQPATPPAPAAQPPTPVRSLFGDLTDKITDDIVSEVMNDPAALQFLEIISRDRLEQVMREQQFEASGVVDLTTAAKLGKLLGSHDILTGRITQILYTPEKTVSRQVQQEATVVLRTETYKDSAGNDQQRNIEGKVYATVTVYNKTSSVTMAGSYSIIAVKTAAVEKTESFENKKDFAGEWATYTGDKRALGDYAPLCDQAEPIAPSEAELVSNAAKDLSHSLATSLKTFLR
jgi:hypothetical protein